MQDTNASNPAHAQSSLGSDKTYAEKTYDRTFDAQGNDSLAKLAKLIPANTKVLDVGCGNADLGAYLRREKQCHVTGLDYSEAALTIAKDNLDAVAVIDLNTTALTDVLSSRYDVIVFADILEHIVTPYNVLCDAKSLLRNGGKILVSIPNAGYVGAVLSLYEGEWEYRNEGILDTTHVRYYTGKSLMNMLTRAGLSGRIADRVNKDLTASEFSQRMDALPGSVRDWLCAKPEAATYQFIAEATVSEHVSKDTSGEYAESVPETPLTLKHLTKLYVHAENGAFTEDKTYFCHGEMGQKNVLRFDVDETEITAIQFAFADRASIYELYQVDLFDGEEKLNTLTQLGDVVFEQATVFSDSNLLPMRLVAFAEGASVRFTLPEAVNGTSLSVRFHLHAPISASNLSFVPQVSESLYLEQQKTLLAQTRQQFEQIEKIAKLYQEAVDYQQTLEARIQSLESDKKQTEAELSQTITEKAQQLDNAEAQIDGMLASASWKVTAPLRWLNARLRSK